MPDLAFYRIMPALVAHVPVCVQQLGYVYMVIKQWLKPFKKI